MWGKMVAAIRGGIAVLSVLALGAPEWAVSSARAQVPAPITAADPNVGVDAQTSTDSQIDSQNGGSGAAGQNSSGEPIRRFWINAGIGVNEIYNSNALGLANARSDWTTQGTADLDVHAQSARYQADLSYSLTGNYHSNATDLNAIENYLNAIAHTEILQDHLFLSGRAFAQPTFLSRLGSLSASNSSATVNNQNAYGYVVTPDFAWRFGDFARSDLTVVQSGVFFSDLSSSRLGNALPVGRPQSATATTIREAIRGGDYFGPLEWMLTGSATNASQTNFRQKQWSSEADIEYHVSHTFGIIADVGYSNYTTRPVLLRSISGVIAMGGFSFNPNPDFNLVVKAGKQYNFTSFTGNLVYQFAPTSAFQATLDDAVMTPQNRLLMGLDGLEVSRQGGFSLPITTLPVDNLNYGTPLVSGQPINIAPLDGLALDNTISRYRTGTGGFIHRMPRTTIFLMAYGTVRDYLLPVPGFDLRQDIYGVNLGATRDLTRNFSATVTADYSIAHEFSGTDKLATASTFLDYRVSQNWSANLRASYIRREAKTSIAFANGTVSDVQIGVGMRYNF